MNITNNLNDIIDRTKEIALDLEKDTRVGLLKNDLTYATTKTIDKAANYIIKSMPVPDAIKDILVDVKESFKTRDIKQVVKTVVKSSVREGMELMGFSTSSIDNLMDLKNIAIKGGFITNLKDGIGATATEFLKGSIVGEYVYNFFDKLKNYVMSRDFMKKINQFLTKLDKKRQDFMDMCTNWYKAYDKMDVSTINAISEKLDGNKYILGRYRDCLRENQIIQNLTAMVNNKNGKLSINEQRLCQVI